MSGRGWRVRPIRAVSGRVQSFAVERRSPCGSWREWGAFSSQSRAMTVAHRIARIWDEAAQHEHNMKGASGEV